MLKHEKKYILLLLSILLMLHNIGSFEQIEKQLITAWNEDIVSVLRYQDSTEKSSYEICSSSMRNRYPSDQPLTQRLLIPRQSLFIPFAREADGLNSTHNRETMAGSIRLQRNFHARFIIILSYIVLLAIFYTILVRFSYRSSNTILPLNRIIICYLHDQDGHK